MKHLLILAPLLLLPGCQEPTADGPASVVAADATCRPTPNGRNVSSCYLTLTASRDDRLVAVSTPVAAAAQIHEMSTEGGVMRMGELENGLPLAANQAVALEPGGVHIMLMDVQGPLTAGDAVPLTLTFAEAEPLQVDAAVAQPSTASHSGGH